ncbi:MAG: hypothetical protein ACFE9T_02090 [Promethearchaeota archaeon]
MKKPIVLLLSTIMILSFYSSNAFCDTTIGDATFPADEGDSYKWVVTYCHPMYNWILGAGSYLNVTIDAIYSGSYGPMTHALIINATVAQYFKGLDQYSVWDTPFYIVYNNSMHFLYAGWFGYTILPIPLNLTLAADFAISLGYSATVDGNTLTLEDDPGELDVYNFNSHGFVISAIEYENYTDTVVKFELSGVGADGGEISYGNYFLIYSISTVVCLIVIVKIRHFFTEKGAEE